MDSFASLFKTFLEQYSSIIYSNGSNTVKPLIESFMNDKSSIPKLLEASSTNPTKESDSNTNSENSDSVDNNFVKLVEKKIVASIYSDIMKKILNKDIQHKIMSGLQIDKIIDCFNLPSPSKKPIKILGNKRKSKTITDCPHTDRKHYARNMCENCYHTLGRKKKPWECSHTNKYHYAHGLCHNCYQSQYVIFD
jgi:hypothetical protein